MNNYINSYPYAEILEVNVFESDNPEGKEIYSNIVGKFIVTIQVVKNQ